MTRRDVKVPRNAFRVLLWLPDADNPDDWATGDALTQQLANLYGPGVARNVPGLLGILKTAGYAVRRRDTSGVSHWRRTPTGTKAAREYEENDQW